MNPWKDFLNRKKAMKKAAHPAAPQAELSDELKAKLEEHARQKSFQITFYVYDRGQCFDKEHNAVMAIVNVPGGCAHYMWTTATRDWEFVQLPHMSTEQRCAERIGLTSIEKMRQDLFIRFNQWMTDNDVFVKDYMVHQVRGGKVVLDQRKDPFKTVRQWRDLRDELQLAQVVEKLKGLCEDERVRGVPDEKRLWRWSVVDLKRLIDRAGNQALLERMSPEGLAKALEGSKGSTGDQFATPDRQQRGL